MLLLGTLVLERLVLRTILDRIRPQLGGVVGELGNERNEPPATLRRITLIADAVRWLVALEKAGGVKARVVVLLMQCARLELLVAGQFVHVAEPHGLHLLARVRLAVAHEALLVQAARLGVRAAFDRLGEQVEMADGGIAVQTEQVDEVLVEQTFSIASVARRNEKVLKPFAAEPALEDAHVSAAQFRVRKDALEPRGDLVHISAAAGSRHGFWHDVSRKSYLSGMNQPPSPR